MTACGTDRTRGGTGGGGEVVGTAVIAFSCSFYVVVFIRFAEDAAVGSGGGVVGSCVRKRVRVKATLGGGGG